MLNKKVITMFAGVGLTLVSFIGLVSINNKISNPNGVSDVVIAIKDVSKGTVIDSSNVKTYFKVESKIDNTVVPTSYIKDINEIDKVIVNENIYENEIINKNNFIEVDSVLSNINKPREISIELDGIGDGVGGILRKGDIVDISISDDQSKQNTTILKNIYIVKALTSDGTEVPRDSNTPVSIVNIIINENDVNLIESAKNTGNIIISKVK